MSSRNPDVDAARFLTLAVLERAVEEATGSPRPLELATDLVDRGWVLADLQAYRALVDHVIARGTTLACGQAPATDPAVAARGSRVVGGIWFPHAEHLVRTFGRATGFAWLRVLSSAPASVADELVTAVARGGDPTACLAGLTDVLDDLAPLAWAAGIDVPGAGALVDDAATRARLTRLAETRGFGLPAENGPWRMVPGEPR